MKNEQQFREKPKPEGTLRTKYCVACNQEIPVTASLCSVCKSHQSRWKNHLQYGASIATLVVVFLSGLFWFVQKVRETFFYREDVRLVKCNTLGSAVIVNSGDTEVFVSQLLLWMPGRNSNWVAHGLTIDEKLLPGQFLKRQFPPPRLKETGWFVRGLNPTEFQKLITLAVSQNPCVEAAFYSESDSDLRDVKTMAGPTLNTFEVAGYLEYWGSRGNSPTLVQIKGTGVLRRDTRPDCK